MTENEHWAAGFISGSGTFFVTRSNGLQTVQLAIKSKTHRDAVTKLGHIAGVNVREIPDGGRKLTMQGEVLHRFMKRLWDGLPDDRKQDYARCRRQLKG